MKTARDNAVDHVHDSKSWPLHCRSDMHHTNLDRSTCASELQSVLAHETCILQAPKSLIISGSSGLPPSHDLSCNEVVQIFM